jgi:transposase InsO family protein
MSSAQVARDLGINPEYIYRWKKEFKEDPAFSFPGHGNLSVEQSKSDLFNWIEKWYNRKRQHSYLEYVSPEEFGKKQLCLN